MIQIISVINKVQLLLMSLLVFFSFHFPCIERIVVVVVVIVAV